MLASVPIAVLSAALRLAAVAAGVAPIGEASGRRRRRGRGGQLIASVVPSGRLKVKVTWSPLLGLVAPRSIETAGGDPLGPVTVAPVNEEVTALSLKPNGEPATSSATDTDVGRGWRNHQPSEAAGAEIGLLALGDQLLQSGQGAVSVEDVVYRRDGRRVDGAAGKDKRSPACVLRISSIDCSCDLAVCWPMVCPEPFTVCAAVAARIAPASPIAEATATPCWRCRSWC